MLNIDNQSQDLYDIPGLKELSDETAAACSGGVRLLGYYHANYRGFSKGFGKSSGNYLSIPWVGGSINDQISSLRVFGGSRSWYKVTLYEDANYKGRRETFTIRKGWGLPFVGFFMNDKTSSIWVRPA
ncbi:MAG: hypothetical protein F6K50_51610 [Moorea sp. SIO3I7]|nr:hypothetical protein [Moorena sp. SIO3I7]